MKYKGLFESIKNHDDIYITLKDGYKQRVILDHHFTPFYNCHRYGAIHLHGHSHNTEEHKEELRIIRELNKKGYKINAINVGCMHSYMNFTPQTLDNIIFGWTEKYGEELLLQKTH